MGATPADGVVDSCGRVFGHRNLMVLDGSIIPVSVRPNPALTILALAERAMARVVAQIRSGGDVAAEVPPKTPGP
jgi:cholesterol oxidase